MDDNKLGTKNEKAIDVVQENISSINTSLLTLTIDMKYLKEGFDVFKLDNKGVQQTCLHKFNSLLETIASNQNSIRDEKSRINRLEENFKRVERKLDSISKGAKNLGWFVVLAVVGAMLNLVLL